MAISVKDLRYKTRQVIQGVLRGERPVITFRGHPVAQLVPLSKTDRKSFRRIGFGMWKDHPDMSDVGQWIEKSRKPRFSR